MYVAVACMSEDSSMVAISGKEPLHPGDEQVKSLHRRRRILQYHCIARQKRTGHAWEYAVADALEPLALRHGSREWIGVDYFVQPAESIAKRSSEGR